MTDARGEVLGRIRAALGDGHGRAPQISRGYRPAGGHPPGSPVVLDLLVDRLIDYKASVHRAPADGLPATLARVVGDVVPVGGTVVVPPGLPDGWAPPGAVVDDGTLGAPGLDDVAAVLTGCAAAAAETGTIVLDGSPDQGRRMISLVPDRHVCVVRAEQVVQTVPELLARLDPRRPLTFVSGPSATSDIELNRVEGVHGPRTLVVVLVEGGRQVGA